MLDHLRNQVEKQTFMATFDVSNLTFSISHGNGIEAIRFTLGQYPEEIPEQLSKERIVESMKLILHNNYFIFMFPFSHKKSGIVMGTKVAPTIANLTTGFIEKTMNQKSLLTFVEHTTVQHKKENWLRFLENCFMLWKKEMYKSRLLKLS